MVTQLLGSLAAVPDWVQDEIDALRTDVNKAQATGDNARSMVLSRDTTLSNLTAGQTTLATKQTTLEELAATLGAAIPAADATHATFAAQIAALQSSQSTMQAAIAALQALKVKVAFGTTTLSGSILAGATQNVTVNLSRDMGSGYSVGYALAGGVSLLGNLSITGYTTTTPTSVVVQVRNGGLASIANLSTASVSVVAAKDA